jgi:dTDP-4-dehydrorhamnose 3,5-epimerase
MKVTDLELSGLKLIQPTVFGDDRGFFLETYSEPRYRAVGIDVHFQQDNHSRSIKGTLRGLHYQSQPGQAKLVRVASGRIWDVAVDIRPDSSTFGRWHAVELNDQERQQLFVPVGFAHGFCVLSEFADVQYKVSTPYDGATECGLSYDDPDLNVAWPVSSPLLSARDQQAESFASFRARVRA